MTLLTNGRLLRLSALAALIAGASLPVPAVADSSPAYDLSGVWKNGFGQQFQIVQEDKRITVVAVDHNFAQLGEGFYTGPNTVSVYLRRRSLGGNCVTVLKVDWKITSSNSMNEKAAATESTLACGVPPSWSSAQTNTRV